MSEPPESEIHKLDRAGGAELIDRQARRCMRMSGEQFATKWRSGELDPDANPDVMRVAVLLPIAGSDVARGGPRVPRSRTAKDARD